MARMLTSPQWVVSSQERGVPTGLAVGRRRRSRRVTRAWSPRSPRVRTSCRLPRWNGSCRARRGSRLRSEFRARAAAKDDDDTAAARVVPGRANQVGFSRVVSSHPRGREAKRSTRPSGSAVVLPLEEVMPAEQIASCRSGSSRSGEHPRLRPSCRWRESCRD